MFDKITFAKKISQIKELYPTQEEFCKQSGIGRTSISQYMNAKLESPPKPQMLEKIANASKGITSYRELMSICGYIELPYSAGFEFASDNDKLLIKEAIDYAISKNISPDEVQNNHDIILKLKNIKSIQFSVALDITKKEIAKEKIILGRNIISNIDDDTTTEIRAIARDVAKLNPEKKELFKNLLKQMSDEANKAGEK